MTTLMPVGIIMLILFIVYMIFHWNKHLIFYDGTSRGVGGKIWLMFYAPIFSLFFWLMLTAATVKFIGQFPEAKRVPDYSIKIAAMNDVLSSEGDMFLGCGTIEGVSYYFYYQKTSEGGYKQAKIKVDNVTIFENDSILPKIQYYKHVFVDTTWDEWAIPGDCDRIDIFVPRGSVKQNYNFDLN